MTRPRVAWLVVAATALVGASAWLLWPRSERAFYDYLDERRATGLATTRDEIRGPDPAPEDNGADALRAAWDALLADFGPTTSWKASGFDTRVALDGPWPDSLTAAQRADLAATATRLRPGIDAVGRAIERPRLRFPLRFDSDGWRDRDDVMFLASMNRTLSIAAGGEPDAERRLAACRSMLLLAAHTEPDTVLSWMVANAIRSSAVAALRDGVESGALPSARVRAACDDLLRASPAESFRRANRGEAVELAESYRALVEGRAVSFASKLSLGKRLEAKVRRVAARFSGGATPPEFEVGMASVVVAICRTRDALSAAPDLRKVAGPDGLAEIDPDGVLRTQPSADFITKVTALALKEEAAARLARVALAAAEFRATHGDFPASLDELTPMFTDGVPLDPFTDAPFVYGRTATGVRVASAGRLANESALEEAAVRERILVWNLGR